MDNKELIDDIYGDKCECGNKSETIHTCPFSEDSETLCNCCSECTHQCAMDI